MARPRVPTGRRVWPRRGVAPTPAEADSREEVGPAPQLPVPVLPAPELPSIDVVRSFEPERGLRLLGSHSFLRLWLAQCVSSLGDWIGLVAVIALAARIGGSDAAVGIVMMARFIPGLFLGTLGGVLVDRWDRRRGIGP